MSRRRWEDVVNELGEAAWDAATELASMLADECYPSVLDNEVSREMAAHAVVSLVRDDDWRRCIEQLLALPRAGAVPGEEDR